MQAAQPCALKERLTARCELAGAFYIEAAHRVGSNPTGGFDQAYNKDHDKDGPPPGKGGVYFRRQDYATVKRYYNGPKDLPPGLRKKYYRTGKLPPGWEKKIRPFPPELVRVLPPPPPHCERGYIDGVAVVYDARTRIIVDFLDVTVAISH